MAFTWKSSTGYWRVYKDGSEVKHGYQAFQKDQVSLLYFDQSLLNDKYSVLTFLENNPKLKCN